MEGSLNPLIRQADSQTPEGDPVTIWVRSKEGKQIKEVDWRKELALKLIDFQKGDGFWVNEKGRWWEKDPVLVTAYAVITLEIVYRGL